MLRNKKKNHTSKQSQLRLIPFDKAVKPTLYIYVYPVLFMSSLSPWQIPTTLSAPFQLPPRMAPSPTTKRKEPLLESKSSTRNPLRKSFTEGQKEEANLYRKIGHGDGVFFLQCFVLGSNTCFQLHLWIKLWKRIRCSDGAAEYEQAVRWNLRCSWRRDSANHQWKMRGPIYCWGESTHQWPRRCFPWTGYQDYSFQQ